MKANRKKDTRPELAVRSALHRRGARFRCDYPVPVRDRRPIRVDIAFPKRRVAVFVDGCFWHGCSDHGNLPNSNRAYWEPKLARNRRRDAETAELLGEMGWVVVRVWEHERTDAAADAILRALRQ
jgi:DNA mismatch endonuclease (patch repair protein)